MSQSTRTNAPRRTRTQRRAPPDVRYLGPSGSGRRKTRSRAQPLALASQMAARDSALHRPALSVHRLRAADDRGLLRDSLHRAVPPLDLRLQPRRAALGVARRFLHVRRPGDRPLSAIHARAGTRLPGDSRRPLSGTAVAGARARQVVAARDPALPRPRRLPRRRVVCLERRLGRGGPGVERRPGLITLLALFAGVALLFTTRYPRGTSTSSWG